MSEQEPARQQRLTYEKMLYRYSTALEQGDFDTIIAILQVAESDPHLEQLIIETHNEGYQLEEQNMPQNETNTRATQPKPEYTAVPSTPARIQMPKPRNRWLLALERTVAILAVIILIVGTLLLFVSHSKPDGSTKTGTGVGKTAVPTVPLAGIVVAASVSQGSGTLRASNVDTGASLWQQVLPNLNFNSQVGLAVAGQTVYAAFNGQVQAFQLSNGKELWQKSLGTAPSGVVIGDASPQLVVDQNIVYVSGYVSGNLYALNARTGQILWHYDAPIPALLTVANGVAYVLANGDPDQNAVKALQGTNGHVIWSYDTTMPLSATVANGILYVQAGASLSGEKGQMPLFALNVIGGKKLWSTVVSTSSPSDQLLVAQGVVILFNGHRFCGYNTSNGNQAWCTTGPQSDTSGDGLVSVGGVVYGSYSLSDQVLVEAINPQNGDISWSQQFSLGSSDMQLFSADNSLIAPAVQAVLSRIDGKVAWRFPDTEILAVVVNN